MESSTVKRYALVKMIQGQWDFSEERFDVVTRPPYPEAGDEADNGYFYLPVSRSLRKYDEELLHRFMGDYVIQDNVVVERYQYQPTPRFKQILYERSLLFMNDAYKEFIEKDSLEILSIVGSFYEGEICIEQVERLSQLPEENEYPCLEAMIGSTYTEPTIGELTIESTLEAARVAIKNWDGLRRQLIAPLMKKRLYLQRNVLGAKTCEDAFKAYKRWINVESLDSIPEDSIAWQ